MIGVIVLLLLVPLGMLRGLVTERSSLREQAYARVAQGWGGSAVLGGPMLVVPTQRTVIERIDNKDVARIIRSDLYLLPARLDMAVDLQQQDDARYVGIYAVQVYLADVHFKGEFEFAALQPLLDKPGVTYLWHESRLRLPVSEVRSLREVSRDDFRRTSRQARAGAARSVRRHRSAHRSHRAGEDLVRSIRVWRPDRGEPLPVAAASR